MFANDITSAYNLYLILFISTISQTRDVSSSSGQMKCIFLLQIVHFFLFYTKLYYASSV